MDDQTKRVFLIMKEKKMNATQFSKAIGINSAIISQIKNGRNEASGRVLTRIIKNLPDINPDWLMTGKGTMIIETEQAVTDLFEYIPQGITPPIRTEPTNLTSGTMPANEPDLVENKPRHPAENLPNDVVEQLRKGNKTVDKEATKNKDSPIKSIERLIIFYSDKTYETLFPEKY